VPRGRWWPRYLMTNMKPSPRGRGCRRLNGEAEVVMKADRVGTVANKQRLVR